MFTLKVYIYMIVIHVAIVRAEWKNVTSFSKSDFLVISIIQLFNYYVYVRKMIFKIYF